MEQHVEEGKDDAGSDMTGATTTGSLTDSGMLSITTVQADGTTREITHELLEGGSKRRLTMFVKKTDGKEARVVKVLKKS